MNQEEYDRLPIYKKMRYWKYYRLVPWLRHHHFLPPLSTRGIKVGDKVRSIDPEMRYGCDHGIVSKIMPPNPYDNNIIQVEFPDAIWWEPPPTALVKVFTEYFEPGELEVLS